MADLITGKLEVNRHSTEGEQYQYLFSVEEVNKLVDNGVPFRDAYRKIAQDIKTGNYHPEKMVRHSHEGSIGNLCNDKIALRMKRILQEFNFRKTDIAIKALLQYGKK